METKRSEYRIFTDTIKAAIGEVNWGAIGRLAKVYKKPFILNCVSLFTEHAKTLSPKAKAAYLVSVCNKHATSDNYVQQEKKLDMGGF